MNATLAKLTLGSLGLALLICGCGDDNEKQPVGDQQGEAGEAGDAGASSVAGFEPAIGPEDCVTSTSEITLSQPEGADVWGGLAVLEFEVEGARVDQFDIQVFDPSLEIWTSTYIPQTTWGQRDDGSYYVVVSPPFNERNQDQELKLRLRPAQTGCPDAEWTETESFGAGDPIAGTTWSATIPGEWFNGELNVDRQDLEAMSLPAVQLSVAGAGLSLSFGDEGDVTEVVSIDLAAEEADLPFDGCHLELTFEGTYRLTLRQQYGSPLLVTSDLNLTSTEGSDCALPALEDLALAEDGFAGRIRSNNQGFSIDYLPLLYSEPAAPVWYANGWGQIFEQLPQFLGYQSATETGYVSGYVYPNDLVLERE